jgi:hypothetical protein
VDAQHVFQAIGSVGLILLIVAFVFVAVPITVIDPETMVLVAILVGGPLLVFGIAGAWVAAAGRWGQKI